MSRLNPHELSAQSDTLTQQSPQKYIGPVSSVSPSNPSGISNYNLQIQYMRFKEQSKRSLQTCYRQIELLKQQLYRKNEEIQNLQDNIILKLRQELNHCRRDNIKYCQSEEKLKKQTEKLKADNQNILLQNDRIRKQRKIYSDKLQNIKGMYEDIKRQLQSKQKNYRKYYDRNSGLQQQLQAFKLEIQDLRSQLRSKDKTVYESQNQYKSMLQRIFSIQNELRSLQIRCRDQQLIINSYQQKTSILEKQREQLLDRIDDDQKNQEHEKQVGFSQQDKHSLIEVQSLMMQVNNLLNMKSLQKQKAEKLSHKFKASLSCMKQAVEK